jgi:hypothetical protein
MKKILAILSILFLTFGMAFGATETATVTLNANVSETALNSGIRVRVGDLESAITSRATFEEAFTHADSVNNLVISATEEISLEEARGYFTVMVKRANKSPVTVGVSADAMQRVDGAPYYLGFKIIKKGEVTALINTTSSPSSQTQNLTYLADNVYDGSVRDTRVFEYVITQNTTVPLGHYQTNIYFSITIE